MSANGDAVRGLHAGEGGQLRRDALFDMLADDVEWHAAGPLELFPWGGTHRGHDGVRRWFATLNDAMAYSKFELRELYEDGDTVVEVIAAAGEARATGQSFASEVVRIWSFRGGKAIRVRSYYDTYAYARALGTASA
jgi:ketosteroid isomerase-like protein